MSASPSLPSLSVPDPPAAPARPAAGPPPTLRVLQIGMGWLPDGSSNGLDRVVHALIEHLPHAHVDVTALTTRTGDRLRAAPPSVHAFSAAAAPLPGRLVGVRRAVRALSRQASFDLVASHFALYTLPALDLLRRWPLVVHFHGPWSLESQVEGQAGWVVRAKAAAERLVYGRASRLVVLSEAFRTVLVETYRIPPERVRVVPGGVRTARYATGYSQAAARAQLGWPLDRPVVLSVRRLVHRVGLEGLVDSIRTVRRHVPDVLLLIGGTGPLADTLAAQVEAAGLSRHVRLLGYVAEEDLPLAYRAADVSIVPTVALEGFGLTAVESLAAGTPVLVSPVGGLREIVQDLSPSLILPDTEPATMGRCLADVLYGRTRLPDALTCQTYARSRFDWSVIATQMRGVYEEVVR